MVQRKIYTSFIIICCALQLHAQNDSAVFKLDSTVFSILKSKSLLHQDIGKATYLHTDSLIRIPSLLGNADPVRFVSLLPGVQTGTEIDAGLHIQGCEHSQTMVSSFGVPIYGAMHLLGLFSVFIPSHYNTLSYSTYNTSVNRLGGHLDLVPKDDIPKSFTGEVSAGLISAQSTLRFPLGQKSALSISGRQSWLNLLYGRYMRWSDYNSFKYGFRDGNLTWFFAPDKKNRLWLDFYGGKDKWHYDSFEKGMDLKMTWGNYTGALHWVHDSGDIELKQSLFCTSYYSRIGIDHDYFDLDMPSDILTCGYKASLCFGRTTAGIETDLHLIRPQIITVHEGFSKNDGKEEKQKACELTWHIRHEIPLGLSWNAAAGCKLHGYIDPEGWFRPGASPFGEIFFTSLNGLRIHFAGGLQRQYLFQTGLSNIGLPFEFWFAAGKLSPPQTSVFGNLSLSKKIFREKYSVSAELFYRKLKNQVEYIGSFFDLKSKNYSIENSILKGSGENYGLSLLLIKATGKWTGWIGYTLSRSLRRFNEPSYPEVYPSYHERIHELNLVLTGNFRKWNVGIDAVAASGAPYTRLNAIYTIGGQPVGRFGTHNGSRMRPYIRLDFSLTYFFSKNKGKENGMILSVYNANGRKNDLHYAIEAKENKSFAYKSSYNNIIFLPSLGYFHKF